MEKIENQMVTSKQNQSVENSTIFDTKFMRVFKWFIPSLIVFVMLMINYACKGIAPFGSRYISYIDMEVGYVPVYYSLWDAVRGGGNFFYNFFLGAGSNDPSLSPTLISKEMGASAGSGWRPCWKACISSAGMRLGSSTKLA